MNVNPKHDRQGVRTPSDIERKYNLGDTVEIMEIAVNAQRAATNAQAVASEANAAALQANATAVQANEAVAQANEVATQANATATQANETATQASTTAIQANASASTAYATAAQANATVTALVGNVYTKEQTLSSAVKEQLGLDDTATPSDAFAALGLSAGGESAQYAAGENISITGNVISVITTDEAEIDNTRPITSAGVYTQIGNINVLLSTI